MLAPSQPAAIHAGKTRFKKGKASISSKECMVTVEAKHFLLGFTGASILVTWPPREESEGWRAGPYLAVGTSAYSAVKCARAASGSFGLSCGCGLACCCCPRGWRTRGSREKHESRTHYSGHLGGPTARIQEASTLGGLSANFWERAYRPARSICLFRERGFRFRSVPPFPPPHPGAKRP